MSQRVIGDGRSELLRRVEGILCSDRPTYHVWNDAHGDGLYLYDLGTGSVLSVERSVFDILSCAEDDVSLARWHNRLSARWSDGDFVSFLTPLLNELSALAGVGFFRLESRREREHTIDSLLSFAPRGGQLLVQTSCNLKCGYCYEVSSGFHGKGSSMSADMGRAAIDRIFDGSKSRTMVEITFFGGEPLLNWTVVQELVGYAVARAKQVGKVVHFKLTTNATLLDDSKIDFLIEHRFGVMVSLDGDPSATTARMDHAGRRVEHKVLRNAKRLVERQRAVGIREASIRATMYKGNHSQRQVAEFLEDAGFRRIVIGAATGRVTQRSGIDIGAVERLQMRIENRKLEQDARNGELVPRVLHPSAGDPRLFQRLEQGVPVRRSIMCGAGRNMMAVDEEGKMYPCHRFAGEERFVLGSVQEGINPSAARRFYASLLSGYDEHCSSCWARGLCGGQCPWYLSDSAGDIHFPDEESCDGIRRALERALARPTVHRDAASHSTCSTCNRPDGEGGP